MEHEKLTEMIIGSAMKVHRTLGPGFLESVYQKGLSHELRKVGLDVECGKPIQVIYDGIVVGDFTADMLVEGVILIENKAVQALILAHEVQLVNYLTATGIEIGLLLNFGAEALEFSASTGLIVPGKPKKNLSCKSCECCRQQRTGETLLAGVPFLAIESPVQEGGPLDTIYMMSRI
jgi:GxxExxY protein